MSEIVTPADFGNVTADAVVIGGGIVGASTAFWLSKAGMKVILLEKREGLSSLSTAASVESFRTQFTESSMAQMALSSVEMLENFKDVVGIADIDINMTQNGYLFVTDDPEQLPSLEKALIRYRELGVIGSELIKDEELHERFPYLSPKAIAGAYNHRDGWISTHETTYGFVKGAADARFFMKTLVTAIQTDQNGICGVETDKGSISTRIVVNCAGPYAGAVGKMVGMDMPLRTVRRQKAYIRTSEPGISHSMPFTIDITNHSYWRPEAGGVLCAWVDPDEPESKPSDEPKTDWDFAAESIHRVSQLTPMFDNIAENLKAEDVDVSAGFYVYTPDDRPVIGPSDEIDGFHLNCGYWCGVMMAPASGRKVADIVTGKIDNRENAFRYGRFKEGDVEKGDTFLK